MGITERKEREREARRITILNGAESVFKSKGFAAATMDDVARAAELAKGTVYLYYNSKEELMVGLVIRGLEMMTEFMTSAIDEVEGSMNKIIAVGEAYWKFAEEHHFYFAMMHSVDPPQRTSQVSEEMVTNLNGCSSGAWQVLVQLFEQGKQVGVIREEVDSFTAAILIWMNSTAVLRFHHKVRAAPDSVWNSSRSHSPCAMDMRALYQLNTNILLHEIATDKGRQFLRPLEWTSSAAIEDCTPRTDTLASQLAPFADIEIPYAMNSML